MGKWKKVNIVVEETFESGADMKTFEIERQMRQDGVICFEGRWITPESIKGKLVIKKFTRRPVKEPRNLRLAMSAAMLGIGSFH